MKSISRRQFCKAGMAIGFAPALIGRCAEASSTVVVAASAAVRNADKLILASQVLRLLDIAMENYFQQNVQSAWKTLVTPQDTVGLKINTLAGRGLATHIELVEAICERLQQAGVPGNRIIIWDRMNRDLERAGFRIITSGSQPRCYGNDVAGYSQKIYEYGSAGSRVSRILTEQCSAIINLPVLKDHGIVGASAGLKNFFGAIDNPNKYHDSVGDPYVADVNMFAPIRQKHRLTICDALTSQYEGGPPFMAQWCWPMNSLLVSRDMPALDRIGWEIIDAKRKENKLPLLKEAGREPRYIMTAADPQHNLGIAERDRITVVTC